MGYKKPTNVTRKELINFPLPHHGGKYKIVSHKFVIDQTLDKLKTSGFIVTNQVYKANKNGNVAQGILHLRHSKLDKELIDDDLDMMFAWTNSYDKSKRFSCCIGANVVVCGNGLVAGEINYARKHIGTADYDIIKQISKQVDEASKTYKELLDDKDELVNTNVDYSKQCELLGRLFAEEEILDPGQLTIVKNEMKEPSYDYGVDNESAWAFYNHVTHAMKKTHPKTWMEDQAKFHRFMTMKVVENNRKCINDKPTVIAPPSIANGRAIKVV